MFRQIYGYVSLKDTADPGKYKQRLECQISVLRIYLGGEHDNVKNFVGKSCGSTLRRGDEPSKFRRSKGTHRTSTSIC